MKFGGTSVGRPERMHHIVNLVTNQQEPVIVVLSALSGTTNALEKIGQLLVAGKKEEATAAIESLEAHYQQFASELANVERTIQKANTVIAEHFDFLRILLKVSFSESLIKDILAQGELLSTKLFIACLEEKGVEHVLLPALDFMLIDEQEEPALESIREKLIGQLAIHESQKLFITQGYICKNAKGEVDNLKRGGSDYTASLIAAAVRASVCEIWTDIDGMHNNDPRVVRKTVPVEQLSFDEAAELAYFGAKILHPASIWPAQWYNIPVKLLNTLEPKAKGTLITSQPAAMGVKAVAAKDHITAIHIRSSRMLLAYGFLRKIFEVFEKYRTPIDMVTTSEVAVSLTIDSALQLPLILQELAPFGTISVDKDQTIVSLVGQEIASDGSILTQLAESIKGVPIGMISYGGSPHNISLLTDATQKTKLLQQINKGIFGLDG